MSRTKIIITISLFTIVCIYAYNNYSKYNPFDEVIWIEDYPGATDRYVQYTPVSKSSKKPVGPTVGADFATLRFRDLDDDGIKEAIIETEVLIEPAVFYYPQRHVLKFQKGSDGTEKFVYAEGPGPD